MQGVWDIDEFNDLEQDPGETRNLIYSPEHQSLIRQFNQKLFTVLEKTGGNMLPLRADSGNVNNLRRDTGSAPARFPAELTRKKPAQP